MNHAPITRPSYSEQVETLFAEMELAVKWKRPSILFVFYDSRAARLVVEHALSHKLAEIGQQTFDFQVDENRFDIPLILSEMLDKDKTVFMISGVAHGGGQSGTNAYKALNIRREYFVENKIRAVIWLTPSEAVDISLHAPDFWAFRHHVVDLVDQSSKDKLHDHIHYLWHRGEVSKALRASRKTIQKYPEESRFWLLLGNLLHTRRRLKEAIEAYTRADQCDDASIIAPACIADCYRAKRNKQQMKYWRDVASSRFDESDDYGRACYLALFGEGEKAVFYLKSALAKELFEISTLEYLPMFASLRGGALEDLIMNKRSDPE